MKAIFITTKDDVSIVEVNTCPDSSEIIEKIGGYMEIVYPKCLPGYCLLVDDEGLLKGKEFNYYGSFWYGFFSHGNPIVGDILVTKLDSRGDFVSLTDEDIVEIKRSIDGLSRGV